MCKRVYTIALTVLFLAGCGQGSKKVVFPDPALDTAVRKAINKPTGDVYATDLVGVGFMALRVAESGIKDLSGLEYCTDLAQLDLSNNAMAQPPVFQRMAKRVKLNVDLLPVVDLSPLSRLTKLTSLNLSQNDISDLRPLAKLVRLHTLHLDKNRIEDLRPLSGLTRLKPLWLHDNQIEDLGPLAALTQLQALFLTRNQINDISVLRKLTNLRWLCLGQNKIVDIRPLSGMNGLTSLSLYVNAISDISPLLANRGLGKGDYILLYMNPLNTKALLHDLPTLEARGVNVEIAPDPSATYGKPSP